MAKYSGRMQRTASATLALGAVYAPASSMRRAKIYDLIVGSEATPADNAFLFVHQRTTTVGTIGTNFTAEALDPADAAAVTLVAQAYTANPTASGTSVLSVPLNQRATFRWVAAPGSELTIPATANNGIMVNTPTAGGLVSITETVYFEEQ